MNMIPGKTYVVNYRTEEKDYIECYVLVDSIDNNQVMFYVTGVLSDEPGNSMNLYCKYETLLVWNKEEANQMYWIEVTPTSLKKKGRCPKCGRLGVWGTRASLVCNTHGAWGGL